MKGGVRLFRVRGRHFPLLLLVLIFTTILFWIWEKTPFTNTLLLTKDQFLLHSSELVYDVRIDSLTSVKQEDEAKEEVENSLTLEKSTGGQISDVNYIDSTTSLNSANSKTDPRTSSSSKIKVCNYAKGRWVADNKRPLYSGRGCKQWLSDMWACRLTQRTDFSYEGFRWQPDNCEMPEFDRFTFLKRMRDKTIAFIGDSLGRQQFQSLMCMLSGGEEMPEVQDIGKEYGLLVNPGQLRPDGWAFRFPTTNTTVLYYWSATLCDLEPLNITNSSTEVAMHLDRPPSFMNRFLNRFNVLVLNTGHHWNRGKLNANRWVMYVNGKHNTDRKLAAIGNAKNFTVHSIARWVDSQLPSHPRLKTFFRTISPRHFHNGEWNTGGSCDGITPLAKGSSVTKDESSDVVIESAVKGTRVKILDITSISELRDEAHIARFSVKASVGINDCLHWCLPGIPDTWNEVLCAQVL